jgi:tetratricopeptide (TPR) repeat protein
VHEAASCSKVPQAFNPGIAAVNLAEKILQGVIEEEKGDLTQAITLLKNAVEMEDLMLYNEPRDWVLPARHYLGNTLIKAKQYAEAEKVYKEDLRINPNNAWALTGLQNALTLQGRNNEAAKAKTELSKALKGAM